MKFFIFDFKDHSYHINSFLNSVSLAHKQEKKTEEWFYWKFRDNPFGEAILACSEDQGIITGCVAFGMQDFVENQKRIKGALSFETFVHPDFQGKGLFKKLIHNAESEAKSRAIELLLNFPNTNSLPGFLRLGWTQINNTEYWIKPRSIFSLLVHLKQLKNGFKPHISNLYQLKLESFNDYFQGKTDGIYSEINFDYLKWRFFTYPNAEYIIVNDENCFSVGRVGKRGNLKELQVLFVSPKNNYSFSLKKVFKEYTNRTNCDLISFSISKYNKLRSLLRNNLFLKVPNSTNVCYKILDKSLSIEMEKIEINAINFHTY